MNIEITKYFEEKGIEYKESNNEQFVLKTCPACSDSKFHHFYMHMEYGLWDCKKCSAKGNFNQFRQFYGDSAIDLSGFENGEKKADKKREYATLNYNVAMEYAARLKGLDSHLMDHLLIKRKLTPEIITQFKLGSKDGEFIAIPIYENNVLVNIRYRRDPAKDSSENVGSRYSQEKGAKPALFNGDILDTDIKQIYITEGELDALQLIQRGFENTVSVTLGAGYFPEDWIEKFRKIQQIFLCFDTDEEGISGMRKAAEKLGIGKCREISLPLKEGRKKTDITNFFVDDGHTKKEFVELVQNSKPIRMVSDVKHISDFNERLRDKLLKGEHLGQTTGFKKLDELMGGLRKGRMIVVAGLTNTGKSSFATCMAVNLAENNFPVFYMSLEMPPIDIAQKMLMLRAKLTSNELKKVEDPSETFQKIDKTFLEFKGEDGKDGMPIYLYNGSGMVKYQILEDCARIAKEQYGCQVIFVDHLHYFATNYGNLAAETSQAVRYIKQLAISLDITIVLLAHLNRNDQTKTKKGVIHTPNLNSLKESSAIAQDADQVLFVCRDSESESIEDRQKCFIKIAKNRDGLAGRCVNMKFDEQITSFSEKLKDEEDFAKESQEASKAMEGEIVHDETLPF